MRRLFICSLFASILPLQQSNAAEPLSPSSQLEGQLDLWATVWDQDESPQADSTGYGDPEHDPGFTIRRARFGVSGTNGRVDYSFLVGVSAPYDGLSTVSPSVQLVDAYAGFNEETSIGNTRVAAGVSKVHFSREMMMSSSDLIFTERSVGTSWLNPNRDVGLTVAQDINLGDEDTAIRLSLGAYNGNSDIFADTDPGLLYISRLEFELGDAYQTWSETTPSAFGVGLAALMNDEIVTATKSANLDFLARVGPLTFLGEATYSVISPKDSTVATPAVPDTTKRLGMMTQVSVYVPFGTQGFEPSFRIATFDDANHIKDNGDVAIMHGGFRFVNIVDGLDLGGAVIHRIEREGRTVANDTMRLWISTSL